MLQKRSVEPLFCSEAQVAGLWLILPLAMLLDSLKLNL